MAYTISEHLHHADQALADALRWHHAMATKPLTKEQETAFRAGFAQGWIESRSAISLHAGLTLADPRLAAKGGA